MRVDGPHAVECMRQVGTRAGGAEMVDTYRRLCVALYLGAAVGEVRCWRVPIHSWRMAIASINTSLRKQSLLTCTRIE
jgi:hypothetical protein